ncbi:MAG TPA: hypothetical protein VMB50_19590 [Myxococcales bacterium]|nr:hypothetical protein [Myxococcales bacterium]
MRRPITFAATTAALLSGCFVGTSDTQVSGGVNGNGAGNGACTTCRRTSGGSGSGAANTGGGNSSTSGGTTGGSGVGGGSSTGGGNGTTGAPVCQVAQGTPDLPFDCTGISPDYAGDGGGCPNDWFGTTITDYATCGAVCGITVQLLDPNGLPLAGYSQQSDPVTGDVYWCMQQNGLVYTPSVTGTNYHTFYYGEIDGELASPIPHLGVFDDTTISALSAFLPGIDITKATAIFFTFGNDQCGDSSFASGWTVTLAYDDGGVYPPSQYKVLYIDDAGLPSDSLTATSDFGVAFMGNVDVPTGTFLRPVYTYLADAGQCAVANEALGYTGRLYMSPGNVSEQGIFLQ